MGDGCGQLRMNLEAPHFSSPCRQKTRVHKVPTFDRLPDPIHQIIVVKRLEKVTNDTVFQSPRPCSLVRIGSNEDGWNLVPRLDQARVELDSRDLGHMDISDQAGGLVETARCEKIGRRWESFRGVTQRSHEPSQGLAKEFIILDDRDQWRFGQSAPPAPRE